MRTLHIITLIFVLILFAFLHVFLQTETIKLGYQTKKNEDRLQQLVENNHVLKYNICSLESPYRLERYLLVKNSDLKTLEPVQIFGLSRGSKSRYTNKDRKESLLFNNYIFLSLKKLFTGKQAEAKTIK